MIKFVCVRCGERLSVPDQNAGRKGECPTCQSVNRIPLKGFAETAPRTWIVAKSADEAGSSALTALAVASALYFALYTALHAFVNANR